MWGQGGEAPETQYRKLFPGPCVGPIFGFMEAWETAAADTLDTRFRRAIDAWCSWKGMSTRAFGSAALGDADFVASLGRGRSPRLATADRVLAFMGEAPVGPAFRAEVEAFLAATGIKRSVLGLGATRNPSFVAHLRRGTSPTLLTVDRVRAWMAVHASATEARAIERRTGTMPDILARDPMRWQTPPSETRTPSGAPPAAVRRSWSAAAAAGRGFVEGLARQEGDGARVGLLLVPVAAIERLADVLGHADLPQRLPTAGSRQGTVNRTPALPPADARVAAAADEAGAGSPADGAPAKPDPGRARQPPQQVPRPPRNPATTEKVENGAGGPRSPVRPKPGGDWF